MDVPYEKSWKLGTRYPRTSTTLFMEVSPASIKSSKVVGSRCISAAAVADGFSQDGLPSSSILLVPERVVAAVPAATAATAAASGQHSRLTSAMVNLFPH